MKKAKLKTIKVLESSVNNLNKVAEAENLLQYEVVEKLSSEALENINHKKKQSKK